MRKFISFLGGLLAIIAILPFSFMPWWNSTYTLLDSTQTWTLTSLGTMIQDDGTIVSLSFEFYLPGIITIIGAVLMFGAAFKQKGAISAIGGILAIVGPIIFMLVLNSNIDTVKNAAEFPFLVDVENIFFDEVSAIGTLRWNLNWGFFLPFAAGLLGIIGAGGKD